MATCASCNQTILFGGKRQGDLRFCSDKCVAAGSFLTDMERIPDSAVAPRIWEIHAGRCPECSGPGPVDVRHSYRVWSGLVVTSWYTRAHLCCRSCGNKARVRDAIFTLFLGWWGIPWGLIMTPIYVGRNIIALVRHEESTTPSKELAQMVRYQLAMSASESRESTDFVPR